MHSAWSVRLALDACWGGTTVPAIVAVHLFKLGCNDRTRLQGILGRKPQHWPMRDTPSLRKGAREIIDFV